MAERYLSDASIEAGEVFLSKLDEFGLHPESAAWLYAPSLDEWRYIVATGAVDVVGRRKLYSGILDILDIYDFGDALTEADIHLVSPLEDWYEVIRGVVQVSGSSRVHVKNCVFNGIQVDAVIYRFFSPPKESELRMRSDRFVKAAQKAREHAAA